MKPHEVFEVRTESTAQFKVSLKKNPSQGKFRSKMVSPPPAKGVSVFVFSCVALWLHVFFFGTAAELRNTFGGKGLFCLKLCLS